MTKLIEKNKHWLWYTTARPSFNDKKMIIVSPIANKKIAMKPSDLAYLIINYESFWSLKALDKIDQIGLLDNGQESVNESRLRHWHERNWDHAFRYQQWSRFAEYVDRSISNQSREGVIEQYLNEKQPPVSHIIDSESAISLPTDKNEFENITLGKLLFDRRSIRKFPRHSVSLNKISCVLYYGLEKVRRCRMADLQSNSLNYLTSYGVAFDIGVVVYDVEGLEAGTYFYNIEQHTLDLHEVGDFREKMRELMHGQVQSLSAAFTIIIFCHFERYQWRYRHNRALRNLYLESGRVNQHILIASHANGLQSIVTPAIKDVDTVEFFGLTIEEYAPMHTITVG